MGFSNHTVVVLQDGSAKGFGNNGNGQLGLGNLTTPITSPTTLTPTGLKQVVGGRGHTVFLLADGTVKGAGLNYAGNLGLGNTTNQQGALATSLATNVKQVDSGDDFTLFLLNDGTVKATGDNSAGQLGQGNTTNISTPTTIPSITGVKQVACGRFHSLLLMNDGTVKSMGKNDQGQLGLGHTTTPISTPTTIPNLSGVKYVAAGEWHSVFVLSDGSVKAVGNNSYGQLGKGDTTSSTTIVALSTVSGVKQVACGQYHTLFLLSDGTVKGAGMNNYGQMANGGTTNVTTPTTMTTNVKQVACGLSHSVLLMNDGTVKTVGYNENGQLGNGTSTTSATTSLQTPSVSGVKSLWGATTKLLKFLIQAGAKYFTYANGWSEVAGEPTENTFKTSGLDSIANIPVTAYASLTDPQIVAFTDEAAPAVEIEGRKDFLSLCSNPTILGWTDDQAPLQLEASGEKNILKTLDAPVTLLGWTEDTLGSVRVTATPKPVLVMPTGDLRLNGVESVDRFTLTTVRSGGGVVKIIVSVDSGVTWKTYSGGWLTVTTDQAGSAGMTPDVLGARTTADWTSLLGDSKTIRFAYYLEINSPTDVAATDKLESQFDMQGRWVVAGSDRYRAEYMSTTVMRVSLYQNGSYKINFA